VNLTEPHEVVVAPDGKTDADHQRRGIPKVCWSDRNHAVIHTWCERPAYHLNVEVSQAEVPLGAAPEEGVIWSQSAPDVTAAVAV